MSQTPVDPFFEFDLSSIPDDAIIDDVTLTVDSKNNPCQCGHRSPMFDRLMATNYMNSYCVTVYRCGFCQGFYTVMTA